MATTERQTKFALSTTLTSRERMSKEHREAYDSGRIDAFLIILGRLNKNKDLDWETLVFTETEARGFALKAVDALLSQNRKLSCRLKANERLLSVFRQPKLNF